MEFNELLKTFRRENIALNIVENCKKTECFNVAQKAKSQIFVQIRISTDIEKLSKAKSLMKTSFVYSKYWVKCNPYLSDHPCLQF